MTSHRNVIRISIFAAAMSGLLICVAGCDRTRLDTTAPPLTSAGEQRPRLYNFDNPSRIPGRYLVVFKRGNALAPVPKTDPSAPYVLPDLLPTSREATYALAWGMASRVKGTVALVFYHDDLHAFALFNVEQQTVKDVLANDPRIEYIEAEMRIVYDVLSPAGFIPRPRGGDGR